eukprot:700206_1
MGQSLGFVDFNTFACTNRSVTKLQKRIRPQREPQPSIPPHGRAIVDEEDDEISNDDIHPMLIIESYFPDASKPIDAIHLLPNKRHRYMSTNEINTRTRFASIYEPKDDPSSKTKELYSFGVSLQYGYENEVVRPGAIKVHPAFMSLKEELTSNSICRLTMEQYDHEFRKARTLFESIYRKTRYPLLSLEQVLSLVIWCNHDEFQYKFSQGFREHSMHSQFYHFGMNLKRAVHEHGTRVMDGSIKRFYRGLNKSLVFPETTIHINGPFSTTSSWAVAVGFADGGIVMEFRDELGFNKYFPLRWLSDWPTENEYLFIDHEYPLTVSDIVTAGSATGYKVILNAISLFKKLITHQPIAIEDMDEIKRAGIIQAMCTYMISKRVTYFDQYSRHSIETFCTNQTLIIIDYDWNEKCPLLFDLSFTSVDGFATLNIDKLRIIFPNIECITALHAPLSRYMVDDIHVALKTHALEYVQLQPVHPTQQMALTRYPALFKQINYNMSSGDNRLCFYRLDCDLPSPCRMVQARYRDEVYNQCDQYLSSNPHASRFVRSVYEH